jgi:HSP90 family molecular chaperone
MPLSPINIPVYAPPSDESKEGLELEETEEEKKKAREAEVAKFQKVCSTVKDALGDKVEKVVVSCRVQPYLSPIRHVSTLPVGLAGRQTLYIFTLPLQSTLNNVAILQERIMKAQALRDSSMSSYITSKKTLELNPTNAIVKELKRKDKGDKTDQTVCDLTYLLFQTALFTSPPHRLGVHLSGFFNSTTRSRVLAALPSASVFGLIISAWPSGQNMKVTMFCVCVRGF